MIKLIKDKCEFLNFFISVCIFYGLVLTFTNPKLYETFKQENHFIVEKSKHVSPVIARLVLISFQTTWPWFL